MPTRPRINEAVQFSPSPCTSRATCGLRALVRAIPPRRASLGARLWDVQAQTYGGGQLGRLWVARARHSQAGRGRQPDEEAASSVLPTIDCMGAQSPYGSLRRRVQLQDQSSSRGVTPLKTPEDSAETELPHDPRQIRTWSGYIGNQCISPGMRIHAWRISLSAETCCCSAPPSAVGWHPLSCFPCVGLSHEARQKLLVLFDITLGQADSIPTAAGVIVHKVQSGLFKLGL